MRYSRGSSLKVPLRRLDFDCLQGVPVIYPSEAGSIDADFWANLKKHEIVILRGFTTDLWPLKSDLFTLETLSNTHGTTPCQVWKQTSEPECSPNQVLLGSLASQTLQAFLAGRTVTTDGEAESAIGVNIGDWQGEMEELGRVLPPQLLFASELDVLRYAKCPLPGLSVPQLAVRSAGSWKGACIETFPRVVLNHGPGSIEIWAVDASSAQKLLKLFQSQLKIDLLTSEKYLWPDENYLMSQNCPLMTGEVLPGDLVLLQAGLLHWEKSVEGEISCIWGLLDREIRTIKRVFEGNEANLRGGKQALVPIYSISKSLLAAEGRNLPPELAKYLYSKLKDRLYREKVQTSQLPLQTSTVSLQSVLCSVCQQELFYVCIVCSLCALSQFCPFCLQSHSMAHSGLAAYTLFREEEISQLCKGQKSRKSVDSEEIIDVDSAKPQVKASTCIDISAAEPDTVDLVLKPAKHTRSPLSRPAQSRKQAKSASTQPPPTPLLPPTALDTLPESGDTLQVDSLGDTTVFTESTAAGLRRYALSKVQMQRMVQNTKL